MIANTDANEPFARRIQTSKTVYLGSSAKISTISSQHQLSRKQHPSAATIHGTLDHFQFAVSPFDKTVRKPGCNRIKYCVNVFFKAIGKSFQQLNTGTAIFLNESNHERLMPFTEYLSELMYTVVQSENDRIFVEDPCPLSVGQTFSHP